MIGPNPVDFAKGGGLVPAIVQDDATLQVLMLAYMDRAALEETIESGEATFFSRSRNGRWRKGETSGAIMKVRAIQLDCDNDTVLLRVEPRGPAGHRGSETCFSTDTERGIGQLGALERTIEARAAASAEESYTARLLASGPKRISQKVGEEGVEAALAGAVGDLDELHEELADLFYHSTLLLRARGSNLDAVMQVLHKRAEKNR